MNRIKSVIVALGAVGLLLATGYAAGPTVKQSGSSGSAQRATAKPSDQQIAEDIAATIAVSVPEGRYAIEVLYDNGVATVRGQVSSAREWHAVVAAVKGHPAVRVVRQSIRVAGGPAVQTASYQGQAMSSQPVPQPAPQPAAQGIAPPAPQHVFVGTQGLQYHWPYMPPYAWPAYAPYPNYSAVQYPRCYPGEAWPYIGPFYPYPEPPLDWRKVELKYFAGHWYLKFKKPLYLLRSIHYYY